MYVHTGVNGCGVFACRCGVCARACVCMLRHSSVLSKSEIVAIIMEFMC